MSYELYKPLRNHLRQLSAVPALGFVWHYATHLAYGSPLPFKAVDNHGRPIRVKDYLFPWDLEILAREVVLNGAENGTKTFGEWPDFAKAMNLLRDAENNIYARYGHEDTVLRELHRIAHRQFPWQRPPSMVTFARNWKIWNAKPLADIVEREVGLTVRQHTELCLAIGGSFVKKIGMGTTTNYALLGIDDEARDRFFDRISYSFPELREHTRAEQLYDGDWAYTFNPLRDRPLVRFDPANPSRVLCPLPVFLQNRMSEGLYYDVCKAPGFNNAFGPAFQSYVGDVLRATLPVAAVLEEAEYKVGKNRKDGIDWLVDDGTATLFIECKTKRLRQSAKFSTSTDELDQELAMMGQFVVQTYKNIVDARAGLTRWTPTDRPLFPVIVTLENWYIFTPPIAEAVMRCVRAGLVAAGLDEALVDELPYTIISIEELEIAGQIMAQTGIQRFMTAKTDPQHRQWGLTGFMPSTFGAEIKNAKAILFQADWDAFQQDLFERRDAQRRTN